MEFPNVALGVGVFVEFRMGPAEGEDEKAEQDEGFLQRHHRFGSGCQRIGLFSESVTGLVAIGAYGLRMAAGCLRKMICWS